MWDVMKNYANILNQMLYKVYVVIFFKVFEAYTEKKITLKKSYKSEYKVEGIYLSIKICCISYSVLKHHHL